MKNRLVALALVTTAVAGLAACGGLSDDDVEMVQYLDTAKIELSIAEAIQEQRKVTANVTCPTGITQERDSTFVCDAKTADGTTPFVVTQKDDQGNVSFVAGEIEEGSDAAGDAKE